MLVVDVLSSTDDWCEMVAKIDSYERNGATYAVAIDPFENRIATRGVAPALLVLDVEAIGKA